MSHTVALTADSIEWPTIEGVTRDEITTLQPVCNERGEYELTRTSAIALVKRMKRHGLSAVAIREEDGVVVFAM